jgi:hypothetical protein
MKKLSLLLLGSFLLLQCNKKGSQDNLNLATHEVELKAISNFGHLLGVTGLTRSTLVDNSATFTIQAQPRTINSQYINLNNSTFTYSILTPSLMKLTLNTDGDLPFTISMDSDKKIVKFDQLNMEINDETINTFSQGDQVKISVSLDMYMEVTNSGVRRTEPADSNALTVDPLIYNCELTAVSFNTTRSRANEGVTRFSDDFIKKHKDCHKIFGVDAGCLWEDYGCVATQSIKCNGESCKGRL